MLGPYAAACKCRSKSRLVTNTQLSNSAMLGLDETGCAEAPQLGLVLEGRRALGEDGWQKRTSRATCVRVAQKAASKSIQRRFTAMSRANHSVNERDYVSAFCQLMCRLVGSPELPELTALPLRWLRIANVLPPEVLLHGAATGLWVGGQSRGSFPHCTVLLDKGSVLLAFYGLGDGVCLLGAWGNCGLG